MNTVSTISPTPVTPSRSPQPTDERPFHDAALARLRASGLRYTAGRQRLVEILHRANTPLTVDEFIAADPRLPMSSVYRDLHHLRDVGLLVRLSLVHDRHHFQFATDVSGRRDLHLVCIGCSSVTTVESPAADEAVDQIVRHQVMSRFSVDRGRLALVGTCLACRTRAATPAGAMRGA